VWCENVFIFGQEISTAVRETAKVNIGLTKAHMKSLNRLIRYVVDTKNYGLVMESKQPAENNVWEMIAYCDSDYAGDKNGSKSVTKLVDNVRAIYLAQNAVLGPKMKHVDIRYLFVWD
jgi:hypothetical protein